MISTIIFDLSEVYLGGMYGIEEKISRIAPHFKSENKLHQQQEARDFFHGRISEDEFWTSLNNKFKWGVKKEVLKEMIRSQMIEIKGTRKIIEKLKQNGYKLGLLSVHGREWIDHAENKFDFHKLFDSKLYSFESGVSKPDPKAFELILKKLGEEPENCLFIDDYDVNTRAARELRLSTIIFENAKQLKKNLISLGIKI